MTTGQPLKAPFPAFGGKWHIADETWKRLGRVQNYVEPFGNSLALLLKNPAYDYGRGDWGQDPPPIETANDLDPFIANFWRAVIARPGETAAKADLPVNEVDLTARHEWLMTWGENWKERMMSDPFFFDTTAAGFWAWGACQWIGSGWCSLTRYKATGRVPRQRPNLSSRGMGVHSTRLSRFGIGFYFEQLATRLRHVRVVCGDWTRVTGRTTTHYHNSTRGQDSRTAVVLDPPYGPEADRMDRLYGIDSLTLAAAVREYALENGDNPKMRIALYGYEDEHADHMPPEWSMVSWQPNGGYGNQSGSDNKSKERVWFSPHCLTGTDDPQQTQRRLI